MRETEFRVRYSETDQMGVVYHANYLSWLEVGRTEYLRDIGLDYREMEQRGLMVPVLDVHCKYRVPAKYDDMIVVETALDEIARLKFYFSYRVVRKSDMTVLAEGRTEHIFVDRDFKPVSIRKSYPDIWEKLDREYRKASPTD